MSAVLRKLGKLAVLTPRQHGFLVLAVLELARARVTLWRRPAKDIIAELQEHTSQPPSGPADVAAVSWAIRSAANAVPWRSDCLVQSLAASRWLRRKGVDAEFRLGVTSSANGSFRAHAWLELDGQVLTGGEDVSDYEVLLRS